MRYKIFKDGEEINTIIAEEDFVIPYCEANGYTYELDILEVPEETPEQPADITDELATAIKEGVNSI